jgi:hypothetical protein
MKISKDQFRIINSAIGTTLDYVKYPHTHNGTTRIRKANEKAQEVINNLIGNDISNTLTDESFDRLFVDNKDYKSLFKNALEILRELADIQNGPPLERYRPEWEDIMQNTYEFLTENEES